MGRKREAVMRCDAMRCDVGRGRGEVEQRDAEVRALATRAERGNYSIPAGGFFNGKKKSLSLPFVSLGRAERVPKFVRSLA